VQHPLSPARNRRKIPARRGAGPAAPAGRTGPTLRGPGARGGSRVLFLRRWGSLITLAAEVAYQTLCRKWRPRRPRRPSAFAPGRTRAAAGGSAPARPFSVSCSRSARVGGCLLIRPGGASGLPTQAWDSRACPWAPSASTRRGTHSGCPRGGPPGSRLEWRAGEQPPLKGTPAPSAPPQNLTDEAMPIFRCSCRASDLPAHTPDRGESMRGLLVASEVSLGQRAVSRRLPGTVSQFAIVTGVDLPPPASGSFESRGGIQERRTEDGGHARSRAC
jgi:hypothetical protein